MRGTGGMQVLWGVALLFFILWIIGLAVGWGGWLWIFFVIWVAAAVLNVLALWGKKAGLRPKR
jgi:hypothetical protein